MTVGHATDVHVRLTLLRSGLRDDWTGTALARFGSPAWKALTQLTEAGTSALVELPDGRRGNVVVLSRPYSFPGPEMISFVLLGADGDLPA